MLRNFIERINDPLDHFFNVFLWVLMIAAVASVPAIWYIDSITPHLVLVKSEWRCTADRNEISGVWNGRQVILGVTNYCDEYRRIKGRK